MSERLNQLLSLLKENWLSGLIVGIVNIPLSLSLAIASGASPLQGILAAVWGGLIASLFASSRHNIFGPAGALSGILLAATLSLGSYSLPMIAMISGGILLLMVATNVVKYIALVPVAVLHGFLVSVGIIIAVSQLSNGLGLSIPSSEHVYVTVGTLFQHIGETNIPSLMLFLGGILFLVIGKKFKFRIPASLLLTFVGIALGWMVQHDMFPVITLLSDKFPDLTFSLYSTEWFYKTTEWRDMDRWLGLLKVSFVVAIVTALETLISAKIAFQKTGISFSRSRELFGNALANIVSGLVGSLPVTAVLVRTGLNISTGATSRASAAITALVTLLLSAFLFTKVVVLLPMPIIAALLFFIAISLMETDKMRDIYLTEKSSFWIMVVTIIISLTTDTLWGLIVGIIASMFYFIHQYMNKPYFVSVFRNGNLLEKTTFDSYLDHQQPGDTVLVKLRGVVNYICIEHLLFNIQDLNDNSLLIISLCDAASLDIDVIEVLADIVHKRIELGTVKIVCSNNNHISLLQSHKVFREFPSHYWFTSHGEAISL